MTTRLELFESHVTWITRRASHKARTMGIPAGDLPDAVNEALLAVWRLTETYDPSKGAFKAYVSRRMYGAVTDYARRLFGRRNPRPLRNAVSITRQKVKFLVDSMSFHSGINSTEEIKEWMRNAFNDRDCTALSMYVDGYTLADIGERLGVSEARACQMMQRIRGQAQNSLKSYL